MGLGDAIETAAATYAWGRTFHAATKGGGNCGACTTVIKVIGDQSVVEFRLFRHLQDVA